MTPFLGRTTTLRPRRECGGKGAGIAGQNEASAWPLMFWPSQVAAACGIETDPPR